MKPTEMAFLSDRSRASWRSRLSRAPGGRGGGGGAGARARARARGGEARRVGGGGGGQRIGGRARQGAATGPPRRRKPGSSLWPPGARRGGGSRPARRALTLAEGVGDAGVEGEGGELPRQRVQPALGHPRGHLPGGGGAQGGARRVLQGWVGARGVEWFAGAVLGAGAVLRSRLGKLVGEGRRGRNKVAAAPQTRRPG